MSERAGVNDVKKGEIALKKHSSLFTFLSEQACCATWHEAYCASYLVYPHRAR